jgi:transposase
METMAKKQARPRRSFTPEFKAEVVELVRQPRQHGGQRRS